MINSVYEENSDHIMEQCLGLNRYSCTYENKGAAQSHWSNYKVQSFYILDSMFLTSRHFLFGCTAFCVVEKPV